MSINNLKPVQVIKTQKKKKMDRACQVKLETNPKLGKGLSVRVELDPNVHLTRLKPFGLNQVGKKGRIMWVFAQPKLLHLVPHYSSSTGSTTPHPNPTQQVLRISLTTLPCLALTPPPCPLSLTSLDMINGEKKKR